MPPNLTRIRGPITDLYTGKVTRNLLVSVSGVITSGSNNQTCHMRIARDGTTLSESEISCDVRAAGGFYNFSMESAVSLSENQYIELWLTNASGTASVTLHDLQISARAV